MTIQTINTNFVDPLDNAVMRIQYYDWHTYISDNGITKRSPQLTELAIATIPDDYLRIECNVFYHSAPNIRYDIRISLPEECFYVVSSPDMTLIAFLYKRILAKQDTWASDIREALPEICI